MKNFGWSWMWFGSTLVLGIAFYAQGQTIDMLAADLSACLAK